MRTRFLALFLLAALGCGGPANVPPPSKVAAPTEPTAPLKPPALAPTGR